VAPIYLVGAFLLLVASLFSTPLPSWAATAEVDIIHSRDQYPQGGTYPILFRIRIASPWYIHGTEEAEKGLIPTRLLFPQYPEIGVGQIRFPGSEKKRFLFAEEPVAVFSGEVPVRAEVAVGQKASLGKHVIKGRLSFQACSSRSCLPPEDVPILLSLTIAPAGADGKLRNQAIFDSDRPGGLRNSTSPWTLKTGLLLTLLGIFIGGLALNLTPCIYPLIPITVSYFGGRSKGIGRTKVIHGLLYMTGLASTNSLLGLIASLSGGMLGSALQNPVVLMAVAGVLLLLGLSFFGLWELRVPSGMTRLASKNFGGYFGTFFMGLTLGIMAAPCLGPFILGLLTYVGQKGDPFLGFLYFFVLSIGLGLPLSILAVFSGALEKLPMSGEWMVWIRKILGWVLVGMAGYMLLPLAPGPLGKTALFTAILTAAGLHLGWLDRSAASVRVFPWVKKALGILLIAAGIFSFRVFYQSGPAVQWLAYDKPLLREAAAAGKPVILDFYADWCGPCRTMEKEIFGDPQVVALSKQFVTIRVDLTKRKKEIERHYQIRGVPTIIFINGKGVEEGALRIESYVEKEEVLKKMRQLVKSS
jgi:thiol:disulfide interchange protein DsbD